MIINRHKRFIALLALTAGTVVAVWAAPVPAPQAQRNTRENITTLMLLRMTQVLDLTEEQTVKLFPLINRIEKEKQQLSRRIGKRLSDLRFLLRGGSPSEAEIRSAINDVKDMRDQIKALEAELEAFVERHLSLEQQAKYLIFFQDFYRQLREKLNEARRRQQQLKPPLKKRSF